MGREGQKEDRRGKGKVCGSPKGGGVEVVSAVVEQLQQDGGERSGKGDRVKLWGAETGEAGSNKGDERSDLAEVAEDQAMGWMVVMRGETLGRVLPGVDEEAVEAAEGGKEQG